MPAVAVFYLVLGVLAGALLAYLQMGQRRARRSGLTDAQLLGPRERPREELGNDAWRIRGENIGPWNGPGDAGGY
jgi:hypothetical protein